MGRPPLENLLSYSFSRAEKLKTCPRRYYYDYYGSWGGWHFAAPHEIRKIYVLKQMSDLILTAGTVVHNVIEEILVQYATEGYLILHPMARERARAMLNEAWQDSKYERWKDKPKKKTNLIEHYYNKTVTVERIDEIRARVFTCIENFYGSDVFALIRETPPDDWLNMEVLTTFDVDGYRVWVKPDLAIRTNGRVHLFDWKTGLQYPNHIYQLGVYGIYATLEWDVEPHEVDMSCVYLLPGEVKTETLTQDLIDRTMARIRGALNDMKAYLAVSDRNLAVIQDFPLTTELSSCGRCPYFELCERELQEMHGGELKF